jgi:hypothetical protein
VKLTTYILLVPKLRMYGHFIFGSNSTETVKVLLVLLLTRSASSVFNKSLKDVLMFKLVHYR